MRLQLIRPQVEPTQFKKPMVCLCQDCQGKHFEHHQEVDKPLKDTKYRAVSAQRYRYLRCGRTLRVYPQGVPLGLISQILAVRSALAVVTRVPSGLNATLSIP
jgi:hypothetical protein